MPAPFKIPDATLLDIWLAAAAEPIGLVLRTNDQTRARARLYAVRRGAPEGLIPPEAGDLELRLGADPGELLLVHTGAKAPTAEDLIDD